MIAEPDNRGKHHNRPFEVTERMKDIAREHIKSFPVMESHYCRKDSKKNYLEEGLTLPLMYDMYLIEMKKRGEKCVSEQIYKETIFKREFNYSFFFPKKDRLVLSK